MMSTLILACLWFTAVSMVNGVSMNEGFFLDFLRGEWDNKAQVEKEGKRFDFIQIRVIPVKLSLFSDPVLYMEEAANEVVRFIQLGVVTDNKDGSVNMKLYNFMNITGYRLGQYDIRNLSNLTSADLENDEDCVATYLVNADFMFGNYPHCRYDSNGTHPRFTALINCDVLISVFPLNIKQKSPVKPYIIRPTNRSFPMIFTPEGFVSQCDKRAIKKENNP